MKLTVTRPFLLAGQRQEIGAPVETADRGFAAMLVQTGKAVVAEGELEVAGPMTTETAGGLTPGRKTKSATGDA
jgi:hypothetical protein